MRAEECVEGLRKRLGMDGALRVATNCMNGSNPRNWNGIPRSEIFCAKEKNKSTSDLDVKHLTNTHNFWTQVYHIIKKRTKNAR